DDDEVFVAATFVCLDVPPITLPIRRSNPVWTVRHLQEMSAYPSCVFVKPTPGYGAAWQTKLELMDTMARAQRLITGRNARYIPPAGLGARNRVWGYVMKASVATVLPRLLVEREGHLDRIVVILDEKTLQDEERHLFRTQLENMAQPIVEVILGARDVFPEHAVPSERGYVG